MGRTLHYSIEKKKGNFTDIEALKIHEISLRLNCKPISKLWTCESFWLDVYDYYPFWKREDWNKNGTGRAESHEHINARYSELAKENKNHIEICKILYAEKLVTWRYDNPTSMISGFTKVQGNELNSLMVYTALIEISKIIPTAMIHLSDEGEFLFCDLYIQKGKVKPDITNLKEDVKRWSSIMCLNSKTKIMNSIRREYIKDLDADSKRVFGLDNSYASYAERYLKEYLNKVKIVMNIVRENWRWRDTSGFHNLGYVQINESNIENMPNEFWFKPELYCRAINPEDFKDVKITPATVMAGFDGEYFGLVEKGTEEITSYNQIATTQKMLTKAGYDKKQLVTLGE